MKPPHSTRRSSRAFTLIEVLVSLIVVSLGMLAVIQTVTQTASNSTYMRDKTIAHWIAMNRLTEARLQPQAPKIDKTSDELEMAGRKWRWTMDVTQTPVDTVRRIDIKVRLLDAPEDASLALLAGFYGSAIAPAGTTIVSWQGSEPGGGRPGRGGERPPDENETPRERGEPVEPPPDPDPTPAQ